MHYGVIRCESKSSKSSRRKKRFKLADGGGLYLLIKPSGKYWRLVYRFAGKRKTIAMGIYPLVTLKETRNKREEARRRKKLFERNIDPEQAGRVKRKAVAESQSATFEGVAREWLEIQSTRWVETTAVNKKAKLYRHILPRLGSLSIADMSAPDVLSVIRRVL